MTQLQPPFSARSVTPRLDLVVRRDRFAARVVTLIDRISNRIVRLTAADWQRLQHADSADMTHDPLWQQSRQAGLLNARSAVNAGSQFWRSINPLRLLMIRVPLFSVDGLAQFLARQSDWLFSPLAIMLGVMLYVVMLLSVVVGWNHAVSSLHQWIQHSQSLAGLGLSSLTIFIATKLIHELAHAVACRRSGAPVGNLGLIFFLGMPSPYCDVSAVAANDSRWSRAAVMAAGVYVEMMLAVIATAVWWLTMFQDQAWLHLVCFQVMMISGISTLLFNSNPLMKLDGYFVLSDMLNVPNLRQQGSLAARRIVQAGVWSSLQRSKALRTFGLACYHVMSTIYRLSVLVAISWFLLSLFIEWHLAWIGLSVGLLVVVMMMVRLIKQATGVFRGEGSWSTVRLSRRLGWSLFVPLIVLLLAFWPLQRTLKTDGVVDVIDSQTIYAYEAGVVEQVWHEYGDEVQPGEPLVKLRNDDVRLQTAAISNQKSLAEMESAFLSRRELQKEQSAVSWELDQAKRNLLETQLVSLKQRAQQLEIQSPSAGVILPPAISHAVDASATSHDRLPLLSSLVGTVVPRQAIWCRVGDPSHIAVYCRLSATQRQLLQVGSPVQVMLDTGSVVSYAGQIATIEERLPQAAGQIRESEFVARCDLFIDSDGTEQAINEKLPLGCQVECHLYIESERVWQRVMRSLHELVAVPLASS